MSKKKARDKTERTSKGGLWKELLLRRPALIVNFLIVVLSAAAFVWDEIVAPLLPPDSERRRVLDAIFFLPWYGWAIIGLLVVVFLIHDHAYNLIHEAENDRDDAMSELAKERVKREVPSSPSFAPRSYKRQGDLRCGLTIVNSGYAACDVHIPDAPLADSVRCFRMRSDLFRRVICSCLALRSRAGIIMMRRLPMRGRGTPSNIRRTLQTDTPHMSATCSVV